MNFYNELLMNADYAERHEICAQANTQVKHLNMTPTWRIGRTPSGEYVMMGDTKNNTLILNLGFNLDKCDTKFTYVRKHAGIAKFKALIK